MSANGEKGGRQKSRSGWTAGLAVLILILCFVIWRPAGTARRSALRVGYWEQHGTDSWSASYFLLQGSMEVQLSNSQGAVEIAVETQSGSASVLLQEENGSVLFQRETSESGTWIVNTEEAEAGNLQVKLSGSFHRGSFSASACTRIPAGRIHLVGEQHSVQGILNRELVLWQEQYQQGARHLFMELPYYTAQYLNLWMRSQGDDILLQLYEDWDGTAIHSQEQLDWFRSLRETCPETIFHGVDVGHQGESTGARYLQMLQEEGCSAEETARTQENISQGEQYYANPESPYRENAMAQNFFQSYEALGTESVLGIFGAAHTAEGAMDPNSGTVPNLSTQIRERYGSAVEVEDLTSYGLQQEPLQTDTVTIAGTEYSASYFGSMDLSAVFPQYREREYWRIENAYEDFRSCPLTGDVLPYNNFPFPVEEGQVFLLVYSLQDGTVEQKYYRTDGTVWKGSLAAEEFLPGDS